jgi:long-subunit acyl-CoA synthetase (AMP-forming)
MTLAAVLAERTRVAPNAPLLIDAAGPLDAAEASRRVQALAARMATELATDSSIALQLDNGVDAVLLEWAARLAERVLIAMPPYFSPAQRLHVLTDAAPAWLALDAAAPAPGDDWQPVPDLELRQTRVWRRRQALRPAAMWPAGTACITYTSGSTGQPRGVCLSAALLDCAAQSLADAFASLPLSSHLSVLPLATLLESVGVQAALRRGASICLPRLAELGYSGASGLDAARLAATLQVQRPHSVILVPQLLDGLLSVFEQDADAGRSLRLIAVGGARVASALLQRADALGLPVFEGYGLSEAGSVACLNRPGAHRPGSVGKPLPQQSLRITDDGEVMLGGELMLGYLGEPARPPGELATGDLGWIDDDGYLHLLGRRCHRFSTSYGRNVSPEWVEGALNAQPPIAQSLLLGEARPWNLALLVPRDPECSDAALAAAVAAANRELPDYARVGGFLRVAEPFSASNGLLTGNGKLRRADIAQRFQAQVEQRYRRSPLAVPATLPETCPT